MKAGLAAVALGLLCGAAASAQQATILPGKLDLPIVDGSFVPKDCGVDPTFLVTNALNGTRPGVSVACVAFPLGNDPSKTDEAMRAAYVKAIQGSGWRFFGRGGIITCFVKPDAPPDAMQATISQSHFEYRGDPRQATPANEATKFGALVFVTAPSVCQNVEPGGSP